MFEKLNFSMNKVYPTLVVSTMSSGKSTLINAIVGSELLPSMNRACTARAVAILDNDMKSNFEVHAVDNNGVYSHIDKASKKIVVDFNKSKDISEMIIEGEIRGIRNSKKSMLLIDTPGINNSMDMSHEIVTKKVLDEYPEGLILYVINAQQIGTYDDKSFLKVVAKKIRDNPQFSILFAINKMDLIDPANGITEPKLFLASAQTAKLIRMVNNGEELSETEEEDLEKLVKRFNRSTRMLPKYASLNFSDKEKLLIDAEEYAKAGKGTDSRKEAAKYKYKAAEINSGIPAIEKAITEYLEKYAVAIKVKTVHDTFMKKVIERNMLDNCEAEWARSKESFDAVKKELKEKRKKCDHSTKLQEFRDKVDSIKLDIKPIKGEQAKVNRRIDKLVQSAREKVKLEEAEYILTLFRRNLENIGEDAQVALDNALNNGVRKSCQDIVEEYAEYIRELDSDGAFNIGSYDMKQTKGFDIFNLDKAEDMLQDEKYITEEEVKVGTKTIKKKGFFSAIARIFGGGYETVNIYEDQQFVNLKQLIQDQVTEVQHSFDKEMNAAINDTVQKVEKLKKSTMIKLKGLDEKIADMITDIDKMLVSQEELQEKVKANAEKAKWIRDFISQVDDLLTV